MPWETQRKEQLAIGLSSQIHKNWKIKAETITKDEEIPLASPMVTPAKSYTATFIKKAMSKSEKKDKKKAGLLNLNDKCMSEPRKKKVNVVLTKNVAQDLAQHLKSVKNSPQTPHDPNKNPGKSALKKTPGSASSTPSSLNPVNLNTQLSVKVNFKKSGPVTLKKVP